SVLSAFINYPAFTFLYLDTQSTTYLVVALLLLLLLTFTISGAEAALFSLTGRDVNMLKTKQHPSAKRIIHLLDERKEVYTSLLISGTFFNISIIVLANYLLRSLYTLGKVQFIIVFDLDLIVNIV